MNPSAASIAADGPQQSPASVEFTLGNTYRLLDESEASFDKLTGTHSKIHDWALYIDVLPGSDPDFIDRVTFEMQDKSFVKSSFTCHSPIRIRSNVGSAYLGKISGARNNNNSQEKQIGQDTEEKPKDAPSMSSRPHGNLCRWRFSTRQQTYGAVDVQISIRGRGGSKLTIPYRIVLNEGGNESYPTMVFVEKRPNHALKPMKMMNVKYILEMKFGLDQGISTSSTLYESAKSVFSRSKIPIRVLSEDGNSEEFGFTKKKSAASTAWSFKLDYSSRDKIEQLSREHDVLSISSPNLSGGHGLNECYKIIEGLPWHCNVSSLVGSLHVRIDVSSTLSIEQLVKLCMNFIKYEESIDSFMPSHRRDDHCCDCRSNKHHIKGGNNKERNNLLSKCKTVQELVDCMNPSNEQCYKLNLSCLVELGYIEFRQHESSKDKTTVTNWIRFCAAFVKNSARLRSPLSLKETTSIEEEFDLLFEYVVKDRALRNFYRDRRDSIEAQERERQMAEAAVKEPSDEMSISDGSSSEESTHTDRFKRLRTT
mmetsp:Transcript_14042/g.28653  ORF Transcript_14042/g.28653 Transcript_14042/m.28653 type:complete len:538 (+) Transcript_14042:158-1771(+)